MMPILLALLTAAAPTAGQEAPDKASPFTAVRWEGDRPLVQFEGDWYGLVSLDGISLEKILAHCQKEYGKRWQKRFGEDLVEALRAMGHRPRTTVALVLAKDGKTATKTGAMTRDNRQQVWRNNHSPAGEAAPETATGARPPLVVAPPRDRKKPYGFEAARIVFKYTGSFEGTETLYVAGFGATQVLDRNKKIGAWERKTSIWKNDACTMIDHKEKRSWTQRIKPADMDLGVMHATDESLKSVGLLRKGTEQIAGKPSVLYEKADGDKIWRSWRWKGIELKIEMKNYFGQSYVKLATEVQEGAAIPASLLAVPAGYAVK